MMKNILLDLVIIFCGCFLHTKLLFSMKNSKLLKLGLIKENFHHWLFVFSFCFVSVSVAVTAAVAYLEVWYLYICGHQRIDNFFFQILESFQRGVTEIATNTNWTFAFWFLKCANMKVSSERVSKNLIATIFQN